MDRVLSFFRVFDLALFLPGAVLYSSLRAIGDLKRIDPLAEGAELARTQGLFAVIQAIGIVYICGLLVHGLQRLASLAIPRLFRCGQGDLGPHWYNNLPAASKSDLAGYFWYMRATCYNLAVALLLLVPTYLVWEGAAWALVLLMPTALLLNLGRDYDTALGNVTRPFSQ